jgi:shikimate 5-dehydrogenase
MSEDKNYELKADATDNHIPAPELNYRPVLPKNRGLKLALIGCGGIAKSHLTVWKKDGYSVVALCDTDLERARERAEEFYPEARLYNSYGGCQHLRNKKRVRSTTESSSMAVDKDQYAKENLPSAPRGGSSHNLSHA